jgi:hypothetical protein
MRTLFLLRRNLAAREVYSNENDSKFSSLRGKHEGRRCFIVGNGPSLRIEDLQRIHELNDIGFAFNKIYLAFDQTDFRPTYYIVEDVLMVDSVRDEVLKLQPFTKLFPYDYEPIFRNSSNSLYYYWDIGLRLSKKPEFHPNPFYIRSGGTVTFTALQLAVFLGCNPIYLIGCDFSFSVPNQTIKHDNEVVISDGEKNHFHPDYRKQGEKWCAPKLDLQLEAYQAARRYADQHSIQIFNATRGGRLEVFERKDLDSVLHQ